MTIYSDYSVGTIGVIPRHSKLWDKIAVIAAAREAVREVEKGELREFAFRQRLALRGREVRQLRKARRDIAFCAAKWMAGKDASAQPYERIIAEVAAKHRMTVAVLLSPCRKLVFTKARREAVWRMYSETALSIPEIGRRMGGRDHTTIIAYIARYMHLNGITERPEHRSTVAHRKHPPGGRRSQVNTDPTRTIPNSTGFQGVDPFKGRWPARICVGGNRIWLGLFDDPEDAHEAYCAAVAKRNGAAA